MEIVRAALGLPQAGYTTDARLAEISFGAWEGLSYREILARDRDIVETREHNKWDFRPPGGETYAEVAARAAAWYASLERDTVVTAHGGTARALIVVTGAASQEAAVHHAIDQGVIYLYADGLLTRYA
jgi:broad specificity phosphatase PhoE